MRMTTTTPYTTTMVSALLGAAGAMCLGLEASATWRAAIAEALVRGMLACLASQGPCQSLGIIYIILVRLEVDPEGGCTSPKSFARQAGTI